MTLPTTDPKTPVRLRLSPAALCSLRASLVVTLVYVLAGVTWIVGSDALLQALSTDPHWLRRAQTWKGVGYVLATGALMFAGLYAINRRLLRHREQQLRVLEAMVAARTHELRLANAELDAFTRSAAHDLKNPLNGIAGFTQLLVEHAGERADAEAERLLRPLAASVSQMRLLIDDLLQLSRVTAGELARREVDVSALARNVVDALARSQPERRVAVHIEPGLRADGDPGLLRCLLDNLIGNAWKYTARRDDARIEIGRDADGRLYVRDNGAGFALERATRLFEPFQRFHPASQFPGTGVGLATCKRIVARHGGTIAAASKPGEGSTFTFELESAARS